MRQTFKSEDCNDNNFEVLKSALQISLCPTAFKCAVALSRAWQPPAHCLYLWCVFSVTIGQSNFLSFVFGG